MGFIGLTYVRGGGAPLFFFKLHLIMEKRRFDIFNEYQLHLDKVLDSHLITFGFNMRLLCALERAGIRTMRQLLSLDIDKLAAIPQVGTLSISEISRTLDRFALRFGMH